MATNPSGATLNVALTNYAKTIVQDYAAILADADFIAPRVVTGASSGTFAKFDNKQAFLSYDTERAIGGGRTKIKFAGETGTFNVKPHGLEVDLDVHELTLYGGDETLIQQAKTRTLLSTWSLSRFKRVFDFAVTSGNFTAAADADAGKWSNANIDPIKKIDGIIQQVYESTGLMLNRGACDFGSWIKLRNNPEVIKRQPGSANIGVTWQQIQGMLAAPVDFRVFNAIRGTTGFGSSTTTKSPVASGTLLMWFAQPAPTQYDPSAIKTFSTFAGGWDSVREYQKPDQTGTTYFLDANEDLVSVSPELLVKVSIT